MRCGGGGAIARFDLSYEEAEMLRKSEVRTPSEQHALRKLHLTRLYGVDSVAVTPELFACMVARGYKTYTVIYRRCDASMERR